MSLYGLPSLPKLSGKAALNTVLGSAQSYLWQLLSGSAKWGVYKNDKDSTELAFDADTVMSLTVQEESAVSDYRIQTGSFVSYNKVAMPMEIPITFIKSGTDSELGEFIEKLKSAVQNAGDDKKFAIAMPEKSFTNMTMTRYSIDRKRENSMNMLFCECYFKEVREAPAYYYDQNTKQADTSGAPAGDATPKTPTSSIQSTISDVKSGISNVYKKVSTTVSEYTSSIVSSVSSTISSATEGLSKFTGESVESVSKIIGTSVDSTAPVAKNGTLVTSTAEQAKTTATV